MKTSYQDLLLLVLEILVQDYQSLRAPNSNRCIVAYMVILPLFSSPRGGFLGSQIILLLSFVVTGNLRTTTKKVYVLCGVCVVVADDC